MSGITAIIPCYNAESFLACAIESVLNQTRSVDEIIVVDDCSTDRSYEIASNYPVTLLQTAKNLGHASARNLGIEAANSVLIAWLDADDYWESHHIETVSRLLNIHAEADVAYSNIRYFGSKCGVWGAFPCEGKSRIVVEDCFAATIVPAMSAITRRHALVNIGGYDPTIIVAPDFDLWLRLSFRSQFICTREITANYRKHSAQISREPASQLNSVYHSRFRFLETLRHLQNNQLLYKLSFLLRERWEEDLSYAWHSRDIWGLRMLLDFEPLIPGGRLIAEGYRIKAQLPAWVLKMYDRVQTAVS